jgi:VWFA-related protein
MHAWRYVVFLVLPQFIVVPLRSQTSVAAPNGTAPTFQARVQAVVVDVVVTDKKGDPVSALHKEDFEVLEDGTSQTITTFEEHRGGLPTEQKLPPMPLNVYTNFPLIQSADSVNVLLLDSLNTPMRDQTYVHERMINYLGTVLPGTHVAIFTLASRLRMIQGVTTDSTELLAVLKDKKGMGGPHASPLLPSTVEQDANRHHIDFMTAEDGSPKASKTLALQAVDPISSMKEFLADTQAFQTEARITITLQALEGLARYLSDIPGRKNVIWFSGSFPTGILPDRDLPDPTSAVRNFEPAIRKTADLLASSQIAIYPIAAEGLATDSAYQANGIEISRQRGALQERDQVKQMQTESAERDSSHSVMEELARDTGGEAFYNTNGLNDALSRVINNGTHYYSLSYTPTDQKVDGRFRRIRLEFVNGKYKLAYRRGYYSEVPGAVDAAEQKPHLDTLLSLMGRNLPDLAQILYKVRVLPSDPQPAPQAARAGTNTDIKGPTTRYSVDFAVAAQDLKLDLTPDGGRRGSIELMLIAYDREGKPLNSVVTKGELVLKPEDYANALKLGLPIHEEIDVPKKDVYLRTGIYDMGSDAAGTLGFPLRAAR